MLDLESRLLWDFEVDGLAVDDAVRRVCQLAQHLVRAGLQPDDDNRLTARVYEMPWRIVQSVAATR